MHLERLQEINNNREKICILGLGMENRQFLDWLLNVVKFNKSQIILADRKKLDGFGEMGFNSSNFYFGNQYMSCLQEENLKLVFKSPGIWSKTQELEDFRQAHGQDSVQSNLVYFIEKFREQIIGITGTKGKSTTSGLINHFINNSSKYKSFYCGNTTNISPYTYWKEIDQNIDSNILYVVELSSFQLQDLNYSEISPKISCITNYYIDHLNQHANKKEYWGAKDSIFKYQTEGDILICHSEFENKFQTKPKFTKKLSQTDVEKIRSEIKPKKFRGLHNFNNLAIVLTLINHLSIELKTPEIIQLLDTFENLPHRLQVIRKIQKNITVDNLEKKLCINFIDDGAATEPDAVKAGIETYTENDEYLWLILDGLDKGGDSDKLIESILITQKNNQLFTVNYCGDVGENILNQIYQKMGIDIKAQKEDFKTSITENFISIENILEKFDKWINELVQNLESIGATKEKNKILEKETLTLNVLFSPSGTSFKDFKNYIERSNWFVQQINNLK